MELLYIECEDVNIDTIRHDTHHLTIVHPSLDFLEDIEINDILHYCDNEKLFKAIIDNDDEILHNYLVESSYVFNKA